MSNKVQLIDPNEINNNAFTNGMPSYEKMFTYVKLTAKRRHNTILKNLTFESGFNSIENIDGTTVISFLGENQKDPKNLNYTTNWYEGSTATGEKQYEGFGITNIKILVNSSYIPQIDIDFLDVRGVAFFNQKDSPYRMLFDFPPPIFYLTFKGFYGKALTYQMHLVKYNTTFKADTGSYVISAKFIAISYAPLTDILFRHIIQTSLIHIIDSNGDEPLSLGADSGKPPINTLDLILKLEGLYNTIDNKVKNSEYNVAYESAISNIQNFDNKIAVLDIIKNNNILEKPGNIGLYIIRNNDDNDFVNVTEISSVKTFNNIIISNQKKGNQVEYNEMLFIGYILTKDNIFYNNNNEPVYPINNSGVTEFDMFDKYDRALTKYKEKYLNNTSDVKIKKLYIKEIQYLYGLDITNYYVSLVTGKNNQVSIKNENLDKINSMVNQFVLDILGMKPTIYNIFKLIMDDVDNFFSKMTKLSKDSYYHHNELYKNEIINYTSNQNKNKNLDDVNIYPFPLIISEETFGCKKTKQIRTAPIEISEQIGEEFPELKFIKEFIRTFITYNQLKKIYNLRNETDDDGDRIWHPIFPGDSTILINSTNPFITNISSNSFLNDIIKRALERYYISTQSIYSNTYYNLWDTSNNNDPNINTNSMILYNPTQTDVRKIKEFLPKIEGENILESLLNNNTFNVVEIFVKNVLNNFDFFYDYVKTNIPTYYISTTDDINFIKMDNGTKIYSSKKYEDFIGFNIISDPGKITEVNDKNLNIKENTTELSFLYFWSKEKKLSDVILTQENLFFYKDRGSDFIKSKFLGTYDFNQVETDDNGNKKMLDNYEARDKKIDLNKLKNKGNSYFIDDLNLNDEDIYNEYKAYGDFVNIFSFNMGKNVIDPDFVDNFINVDVNNDDEKTKALLLYFSNFGHTLSFFNTYPNYLNKEVFSFPNLVEIPNLVFLYMGLLIKNNSVSLIDDIPINYFSKIYKNYFLYADLFDLNNSLSKHDKDILKNIYLLYYNDISYGSNELLLNIQNLYNEAKKSGSKTEYGYRLFFMKALNEGGDYYDSITLKLMGRKYIGIYSELSFRISNYMPKNTPYIDKYVMIGDKNNNKFINENTTKDYFTKLFTYIKNNINDKASKIQKNEAKIFKSIDDKDIITQTYYSFKNINDKWVYNLCDKIDGNGYPFKNNPQKGFISQFAFVDRAMNPIGDDTIINPQILLDLVDDPNVSVFSVISQLLSMNNFEFFPLQNFMAFKNDEWKDAFKITSGNVKQQYPVFVCMYIGGTANYPSDIELYGEYDSDTIINLDTVNMADFTGDCNDDNIEKRDKENDVTKTVYDSVKAFKVCFGTQNQSMFNDIQIDSKEYPETNESIHILAQIAGDEGPNAPVPKGQNLYNLYESRAYKATITGLGNAMIQPTQYFQLTNIPVFNGAYMILSVEHNIEPNNMVTTFSGVKIHKYPMPRVKNAGAIFGTDYTDNDSSEASKNYADNHNLNSSLIMNENASNDLKIS